MAVNLHEKYEQQIQQRFTKGSLLDSRLNDNISFVGAKTVKISTINTVPIVDYNRNATIGNGVSEVISRYGSAAEVGDTVQELTMTQDKAFSGVIDKGNTKDQVINKAGKFVRVQIDEAIIPMMDKYKFERLITDNDGVQVAGTVVKNTAALSKDNVMERLSAGRKVLLDNDVPEEGRTLYVSTSVFNFLIGTDYFKSMSALGEKAIVKGQVGEIFGTPVVEVPTSRFPEKTNFIWIHRDAATSPTKIAEVKVHIDPPGVSGNLVEGRYYFDCFVIKAKKMGIYVDQQNS